ncbi:TP53-target gene 5 protein isoform X1 [Ochotona princeps]|uniref:TP53-target gene 5 protein isoform X1 n=2 Tax=Ochotona princeps TaxID=9978 RepID=UPI002714614A|nr:TP53-target gene 5 protein isoform X1 [Ochotona princeps]
MSPPAKKKPQNTVVFKTQDEKLQDKIRQPINKVIKRTRLKMVLRNLSLLKILKSSNHRILELHNLAKKCWNSLLQVPTILRITSRGNNVQELQLAKCLEENPESKKLESMAEYQQTRPQEGEPQVASEMKNTEKGSCAGVTCKEQQVEPEVLRPSRGHDVDPGAWEKQQPSGVPQAPSDQTYQHRGPREETRQLGTADPGTWFEGLPTRIHLPGPRVMCRASTLRWVKRCCTRFCSASLEHPMGHLHKV